MAPGLPAAPWLSLSPSKCCLGVVQLHPPPPAQGGPYPPLLLTWGSQRPRSLSQHQSARLMVALAFALLLAWPSTFLPAGRDRATPQREGAAGPRWAHSGDSYSSSCPAWEQAWPDRGWLSLWAFAPSRHTSCSINLRHQRQHLCPNPPRPPVMFAGEAAQAQGPAGGVYLRAVLFQPVCPSWIWVLGESKGTSAVPDPSWHKGSPMALGLNPMESENRWCWVPWPGSRGAMLGALAWVQAQGDTPAGGRAGHLPRGAGGGGCIPALPGAGRESSKG